MSDNEQIVGDDSEFSNEDEENESDGELSDSSEESNDGSGDNLTEEDKLEVLINTTYGGFEPSIQAKELYEVYTGKKFTGGVDRSDPELIRVFKELGKDEFNSSVSSARITTIHKKYKDFYDFHEYDGQETLKIEESEYQLHMLRSALKELAFSGEPVTKEQLKHLIESEF